MNLYLIYSLLKLMTRFGIGLCCTVLAWYIRSPFIASIREILLYGICVLCAWLLVLDGGLLSGLRRLPARFASRVGRDGGLEADAPGESKVIRDFRKAIFIIALGALAILAWKQGSFLAQRKTVLNASPASMRSLGKFIVSGYRDVNEMEKIIRRGGVGGIYITKRNVRGLTREQVSARIRRFQEIAAEAGLPPLIIAADHEGGVVTHLAPVLGPVPPLSSLLDPKQPVASRANEIRAYARRHAASLRSLGVNVNFAPVVDVPTAPPDPDDKLTRIHSRALDTDPVRAGRAAALYGRELAAHGIIPTLKHFPGLGRVSRDTHTRTIVALDADIADLRKHDWLPFRRVLAETNPMMMLAHVRLTALDDSTPASYSRPVMRLIREQWKHEGVLITDDFSMAPVAHGPHGAGIAAALALGAGMDLILIAYDVELYYPIMYVLLKEAKSGRIDKRALARSERRLARLPVRFPTDNSRKPAP